MTDEQFFKDAADALKAGNEWLTKGWGQHYFRWTFLVLLNEAGGEIPWPDGLAPLIRSGDPVMLRDKFRKTYDAEPGSQMDQEHDIFLVLMHLKYGMKLHPDLADEVKRLRNE